jgi:hypothetical protein
VKPVEDHAVEISGCPGNSKANCLNCGNPVPVRFCSHCGQDNSISRLSVRRLFRYLVEDLFRLESPLLRTVVELSYRPGTVAVRYVRGHRRRYTNPLKYCLLAAALSVITYLVWGAPLPDLDWSSVDSEPTEFWTMYWNLDPEFEHQLMEHMAGVLKRHTTLVTLLMVPILALLTRALHFRSGDNFAEHSVLALYVLAHTVVVALPISPWVMAEAEWATVLYMFIWFLLWIVACVQFFPGRKLSNGLRSIMSLTLFLVVFVVVFGVVHLALIWYIWAFSEFLGR